MDYKAAHKYLSELGIRPSIQRLAVMDYLMNNKTHPTADEIHFALKEKIPGLSLATIYNTVALLAEHRAILALELDGGRMHYDGDISAHAHFICTQCGIIRDIVPVEEFLIVHDAVPPPGVTFSSVQLTYKGVCEKCNKYNKAKNNTYN